MPTDHHGDQPVWRTAGEVTGLFVYGTLLFPEVQRALLLRVPTRRPATAAGWRVAALEGRIYPGLVAADGSASGALLLDLTPSEWRVIDAFEDDEYELRPIVVDTATNARAYVPAPGLRPTAAGWDRQDFARTELAAYALRCAAWRDDYGDRG
jgi:hypothetical protein